MKTNRFGAVISALILLLMFACFSYGQETQTSLIFGKAGIASLKWDNVIGTPADSVNETTSTVNLHYEITVLSSSADSGGVASLSYIDLLTRKRITKYVPAGTKDTTMVAGIRICYNDSLSVGDILRIQFSDRQPAKIDSVGGLFEAQWDYAKTDTVTTVSSTPDTIVLSGDFPQGVMICADEDLQFRSNRITSWVFVQSASSIFLPIRHIAGDTVFVKTAAIPDFLLIRGK